MSLKMNLSDSNLTYDINYKKWVNLCLKQKRKINFAWWWQYFSSLLVLASIILLIFVLIFKSNTGEVNFVIFSYVISSLLFSVLVISFFLSRKKFISYEDALINLDIDNNHNNKLITANKGLIKWPDFEESKKSYVNRINWNYNWMLSPILLSFFLSLIGFFIPISKVEAVNDKKIVLPSVVEELLDKIEVLKHEEIVQEEDLDNFEEKINNIIKQDPNQWFSHENLEAMDNISESFNNEINKIDSEISNASMSFHALSLDMSNLPKDLLNKLKNNLEASIKSLTSGDLRVNLKLSEKLKNIDPSKIKKISPENLMELQNNLKNYNSILEKLTNDGKFGNQKSNQEILDNLIKKYDKNNLLSKCKSPKSCLKPGTGVVKRGRGDAKMSFKDQADALESKRIVQIQNNDYSKALPSELISITNDNHEVTKEKVTIISGGKIAEKGLGADATWKNNFSPNEKSILRKFYE